MIKGRKVSVIIPAFNKENLLPQVLSRIPNYVDLIYLMWDKPDKDQLKYVKNLKIDKIKIITNSKRCGIGSAIQGGIVKIIKSSKEKNDILVMLAGNGKDSPEEIKNLVAPIIKGKVHYVQGSRYLTGGESVNLPGIRRVINRLLPILWSIMFGKLVSEVTNGFRAYDMCLFTDGLLNWYRPDLGGYEWEYYMNYSIIRSNYTHTEVAVSKTYMKGVIHSKIKLLDGYQILRPLFLCPIKRL